MAQISPYHTALNTMITFCRHRDISPKAVLITTTESESRRRRADIPGRSHDAFAKRAGLRDRIWKGGQRAQSSNRTDLELEFNFHERRHSFRSIQSETDWVSARARFPKMMACAPSEHVSTQNFKTTPFQNRCGLWRPMSQICGEYLAFKSALVKAVHRREPSSPYPIRQSPASSENQRRC